METDFTLHVKVRHDSPQEDVRKWLQTLVQDVEDVLDVVAEGPATDLGHFKAFFGSFGIQLELTHPGSACYTPEGKAVNRHGADAWFQFGEEGEFESLTIEKK